MPINQMTSDKDCTHIDASTSLIDDADYAVVMTPLENKCVREEIGIKPKIMMPFFIGGESYDFKKDDGDVVLNTYMLFCGILMTWFKPKQYRLRWPPEKLRVYLLGVLDNLWREFDVDSLEELILGVSAEVQNDHGALPASRILSAGHDILPDSALIHVEMIMNMWFIARNGEERARNLALDVITYVFPELDTEAVEQSLVEELDYIYMASLSLSGQQAECTRHFWQTAAKRVGDPALKKLMVALADCQLTDIECCRDG